jgi:RHS repeat-associated protein
MNNSGSVDSSEIKEENNYYPFGLKMKGFNNVVTGRDHKYGFGDKEEQDELGLEWMDFHARNYDASLGRWMNIDPLAEQFYDTSPYTYVSNNPLRYDDPTGMAQEDVILRGSQADIDRTTTLIENATTGHYTASVDSNGQLSLTANSISGPAMSEKGKAAVKEIQGLIMSETVTEVDIVSNDINVEVGSIKNNALDIADIEQFDAAGSIGRSSIGALVHELVEQKAKVKAGGIKGVQPIPLKAESMHQRGIEAGNRVDNNRRGFNKNQYFFLESNGEITQELWLTPVNGTININKLNKGKPPVGFIEKT